MQHNPLLDGIASAIIELENSQDWQEALSILNETYAAYRGSVAEGRKMIEISQEEIDAIDAAAIELGFSTEAGGANEGDEASEASYRRVHDVLVRWGQGGGA